MMSWLDPTKAIGLFAIAVIATIVGGLVLHFLTGGRPKRKLILAGVYSGGYVADPHEKGATTRTFNLPTRAIELVPRVVLIKIGPGGAANLRTIDVRFNRGRLWRLFHPRARAGRDMFPTDRLKIEGLRLFGMSGNIPEAMRATEGGMEIDFPHGAYPPLAPGDQIELEVLTRVNELWNGLPVIDWSVRFKTDRGNFFLRIPVAS